MMRTLCFIGLHSWKRGPDILGGCGMGLEWFEVWECRRCMSQFDQVRGCKYDALPTRRIDLKRRALSEQEKPELSQGESHDL
jgi:hypothetical protein